ncbi:uncharacterized protein YfaS (alpha-2-macroglobulin family) [Actimicrobium sp. GrIS 1.19]|uniref:alpha-2-macroglobulin n=1 Tax=Actimicrobium sp. GrIS 1.19 TaxID=3071708 RepID=UPI002DFFAA63|nr:uncharacterized protein YfaS (alpha-2-macroglobulin family) [Actimicrobium sp. GrIS 1.19]
MTEPDRPISPLRQAARVTLRWIGGVVAALLALLFGRVSWQAPGWLRWSGSMLGRSATAMRAAPRKSAAGLLMLALLAAAGWYGYQWWQARPKPVEVTFQIVAPARTEIESDDAAARLPKHVVINFSKSVAPLALIGKDVRSGITVKPNPAGVWHWDDDKTLSFVPSQDWPAGADYAVAFAPALFKPNVRLAESEASFSSAAFAASISNATFYQDPTVPVTKQVVVELRFTHPVTPAELEKRITLQLAKQSDGVLGIGKESAPFTVSYDKFRLNAYVRSVSLPIPKDDTTMRFALASGLSAARGGNELKQELTQSVAVPGLNSLKISAITPQVVTNDKNEPEQVLVLATSALVHEKVLQKALHAWVLPKFHPSSKPSERNDDEPHQWNLSEVTDAVLAGSSALVLTPIPAEHEFTDVHSVRYQADVGRQIYVRVDAGIASFGGYLLGKARHDVVVVPSYPSELKILSQGALLSLSGEHKIALLARDLPGIKVDIGRVLPGQLQHLVSQSSGNFASPEFYDRFGPENLIERFERKIPLPKQAPGSAHYEAVDLGEYLKKDGADRHGLFLLTVTSYDPAADAREEKQRASAARRPGEAPAEASEADCGEQCEGAQEAQGDDTVRSDKRLVLVTDLGILVKKAMDGSQDVYVQSIFTGKPVDGASVEIVGKNGVTLLSQPTDASGHAHFARIDGLSRERAPLMLLVKKAGDLSFLPLNRADRGLDMSRFEVGGAKNAAVADQLSAYLFSDRGIYRPGDTFHIGLIVKPANWATSIVGLPLLGEVVDARGLVIKREKLTLPAGGFIELSHTTQDSAPTGSYGINLYLVKDGEAGALLGSTTIKVQEFQPDRMKLTARFSAEASDGWINPKALKVLVNAQNLFGTPAENRRVTGEVTLTPAFPAFARYPDYRFYDPQRAKEGYSEQRADQTTNEQGDAQFELGLEKYAKATYRVHFLARAFEAQGGRGVAAEVATLVSELPYLVGFKPDGALDFVSRNAVRTVSVIAINPQAAKTAVTGLTLDLVERKFVSVLTKQGNGSYKYESRKKEITISSAPLALPATGLTLPLATATPGNFAYVIRDAQGLEFNRIEYAVAGKGNVSRSLERNAELQLTLNKKDYLPGEDIEVSVRAPYVGAGLITIEREKVFVHQWFKTDTLASVQKIKLPKDFEGNGYVSVQFVRDPGSDEIFTSPLSYGVMPFATSLAARTNVLTLNTPALSKPGQALKVKLTAAQPTRVVLFAVDEGILQVARYQMADPLGLFFQKRMLEVRTSQILDLILPEFKKLMAASAPGGDAEGALGKHLNPFKRKRDKPMVFWSGIVEVKGEREFSIPVPDYFNGKVRVMAVAVNDAAVGVAQGSTTVRGDFVLSPNVPLAVTPGDEFDVSVGVSNNLGGSGKDAAIAVGLKTSAHLQVLGSATQTLKISEQREGVALFRVKVLDGPGALLGSATLNFSAALGARGATLATDVSVRPAVAKRTQLTVGSFNGSATVPVTRDMFAQYRNLDAAVSTVPLVLASGLSSYLASFEHPCTEQLVSQAMPLLVLSQRPEFNSAGAKLPTARSLDDTWRLLRSRQNAEGGFGLWEASVEADEFASIHALQLMQEARERGVAVPSDMLQKAIAYAGSLAASPASTLPDLRVRAYAAYLLTRQMIVTTPMLTAIRESLEARFPKVWQDDLAAAYLASAYQLQKQDSAAGKLIDRQVAMLVKRPADFAYDHYYDPSIRDAQLLTLLSRHFPARARALPASVMAALVKPVAEQRFNTLSSAYLILAFDAYATALGPDAVGKLGIEQIGADGKAVALTLPANSMPRVPFAAGTSKLRLSNDSSVPAYYAITESGYDRQVPKTELRAGLEVQREFIGADGKALSAIKVGDEVTVWLRLRAVDAAFVPNIALVDLMPGGFEPVLDSGAAPAAEDGATPAKPARNLAGLAGARASDSIYYANAREDRVVFYGNASGDVSEITYRIKATNSGTFVVPPAYAESMYVRALQARSAGGQTLLVAPVTKAK